MVDKLSALVIAKPGQLREGLRILLLGITRIGTVSVGEAGRVDLDLPAERTPALVLLDFEADGDALQATLHGIKAAWPGTLCIVLVEDAAEGREALNGGGDLALRKGLLAARLAGRIEEALAQQR